jgi:hypothetical protein
MVPADMVVFMVLFGVDIEEAIIGVGWIKQGYKIRTG